jgi:polysaccharide export outer membrane protein
LGGQQAPITPAPPVNPSPQKSRPDDKNTPAPGKSDAGSSVDTNSYKVGPADILNIRVWNEEKFSGPVAVHQDGKITLPLVGDLPAGDTTPKDIEKVVAEALGKYVVKPLVTVTVQEVGSKKYYLDGMASHPGEYPLAVPTTVLEAISKAGGLQDFANQKKIFILRGDKRIPFNYRDVLHGKNMQQNIQVQPGDHIVIP